MTTAIMMMRVSPDNQETQNLRLLQPLTLKKGGYDDHVDTDDDGSTKEAKFRFLHLSCQACNITQQKRSLLKFWKPQTCFNKVAEQDAFTFIASEM